MKIPNQRAVIQFKLVSNQGGGVYLSQTTTDEAIDRLREFYAGRLDSVTSMRLESEPPRPKPAATPELAFDDDLPF